MVSTMSALVMSPPPRDSAQLGAETLTEQRHDPLDRLPHLCILKRTVPALKHQPEGHAHLARGHALAFVAVEDVRRGQNGPGRPSDRLQDLAGGLAPVEQDGQIAANGGVCGWLAVAR